MNALDGLADCSGSWIGSNVLEDPHSGKSDRSESRATLTPLLSGRFPRLDYTWSYGGKPQEGSILFGFDEEADRLRAYWIDSWHQSARVMVLEGPRPGEAALSVAGSYPAPPGPDWGWRIEVTPGKDALGLRMFNVTPDGQEEKAVEASFARA